MQASALLADLKELRASCLAIEQEFGASIAEACSQSQRSLRNLLHYLALRRHDLRDLQSRLAPLGLSSLGRTESSVLAGIEAVIAILESLDAQQHSDSSPHRAFIDFKAGSAILAEQADRLLGPAPKRRAVRIMVTMPAEAAHSYPLVKELVEAGMDVMRINCAHDSEHEWECMIAHLRRANQETGKHCKILMDLAGPKLRTGPTGRGHQVVRWRVDKDVRGAVLAPARIALVGKQGRGESLPSFDVLLPVSETLVRSAHIGDKVRIEDSRRKARDLTVIHKADGACICTCERGAYVLSGAKLSLLRDSKLIAADHVGDLPFVEEPIRLHSGDSLVLTKQDTPTCHRDLPQISCTLAEAFTAVKLGQPIFFDDGEIEGRIREIHPDHMLIEIVHTAARGTKLGSGKGINLPETDLGIGAMTEKDRRDFEFIAQDADMVGLSFVRGPGDVAELKKSLAARGKTGLGIILKIETRQGFERLPLILMEALRHYPVGVMVARGDLAIEVGFERLAEVQEEMLWLCEAAHVPVIWATQVLENLAKSGTPSRAEITDAAMGVRAECVMLNKGEHILEAVRFLDDVLHRMQAHQLKKRSMLRRLSVAQIDHAASARNN